MTIQDEDEDAICMPWHGHVLLGIVDFTSFVAMLSALVVSTYLLFKSQKSTTVGLWNEQMIFETDYDFVMATNELRRQTARTCSADPIDKDYTVYFNDQEWDSKVYRGIPLAIEGVWSFDPWHLLTLVLTFSALFQIIRVCSPLYSPQDGPDAWRWIEYTVTAPLQIIIICSSFYMREMHFLMLIACLQAALVMLGYLIELQIKMVCDTQHDIMRKNVVLRSHETSIFDELFLDVVKLYVSFLVSVVCHVVIWWIILSKFFAQDQAFADCQDSSGMPSFVRFIVIFEFILFTLFGCVALVQIVCVTALRPHKIQTIANMWWTVTLCYSLLSVIAKGGLAYGFIGLMYEQAYV